MANDLESSIRELAESRARKLELGEWLTSGLRARPSEPAITISEAPQRDEIEIVWMSQVADATPRSPEVMALAAADEASELVAAAPYAAADVLPASETPDTLQPHLLSPHPPSEELDDDDLAVLPSKPSLRVLGSSFGKLRLAAPWQAIERRPALKRSLAAAAVLCLLGGLFLVRRGEAPAQVQTELAAMQEESALLPAPPSDEVEVEPPVPAPTPVATNKPRPHKAPPAPLADELDGPRGPSVARYPDLPNRVLSRLAGQQDTIRRSEPEPEAAAADDTEQPTWLLDR
ncbi:MAG: hypothetical protein ABW217_07690 [Polyangiaceae bacterium]